MGFNGGLKPLLPGKTYSRVYSVCYLENAQMLCGSCLFDQDINVGPSSWVSYLAGLLRGLEKESAEAAQRLEKERAEAAQRLEKEKDRVVSFVPRDDG